MPGPLAFLDGKSRQEVIDWLRKALLGQTAVPKDYHDEGVRSAIASAEPHLEPATRRDLSHAVEVLFREIESGTHRSDGFVGDLVGLAVDLRIDSLATRLAGFARTFPNERAKLSHGARKAVLFAIVDLSIPQPNAFWRDLWQKNIRAFSIPVFAGLLANNPIEGLQFLKELPDSEDFGDSVALQLDDASDLLKGGERENFRREAKAIAGVCKKRIRDAILLWLEETDEPPAIESVLAAALRKRDRPLGPMDAALQGQSQLPCLA